MLGLYIIVNAVMMGRDLYEGFAWANKDWQLWTAVADASGTADVYRVGEWFHYVWSPLLIPLAALQGVTGVWPSITLHLLAVLLLRDQRLILLVLISWVFWTDAVAGGVTTYAFVAGALALRGGRTAALAFFALTALIPRPLMLPLTGWLLWKRPALRIPGIATMGVLTGLAFLTGLMDEWVSTALAQSAAPPFFLAPVAIFGWAYYAIAGPVAVLLARYGRVGFASVVMCNYLLPYYLLMLLWEALPLLANLDHQRRTGHHAPGEEVLGVGEVGPRVAQDGKVDDRLRHERA